MKFFRIESGKIILGKKVKIARTIFERAIGLMNKEDMFDYDGLLIENCNSIHTFFMKFNIDVIFLNNNNQIVKIIRNIRPWRMTGIYFSARKVLELKAGKLSIDVEEGNHLEVICIN